jgi:hypothetical protein
MSTLKRAFRFLNHPQFDPWEVGNAVFGRLTQGLKAVLIAVDWTQVGDFMIVLPDKCLPSVGEEVEALKPRLPHHRKHPHWRGPQQQFGWLNDITSSYEGDRKSLLVQVVGCEETWQEVEPATSKPIDKQYGCPASVCATTLSMSAATLARASGFGIEVSMQVEKRQGYCYEHPFSHHWNAMQGYHYLMRLAHLLNALALATKRVASQLPMLGVQAFLRFVRESCAHHWLQREWIERFHATPLQLRLK